ncbi:hypothetical protein C2W62_08415 [Candidatus Entotheonella serta]|nr:hypothetical protein C2W62_08415 [Candidatus Entotheonella serta]
MLITGGLGELGQALARHLVSEQGVRHLVLTFLPGMDTPGAQALVASLESLGAQTVTIIACDAAERGELAFVLGSIPADHPLTGIFHLAGVLDNTMISTLSPERLGRVLRPKVDGAWHLHALTQDQDLSAFVMFSSVAGVMGAPAQANYAAANTFLDALAAHRHEQGHSALSLAWGLWEPQGVGMTAHLDKGELMRMQQRQGIAPMTVEMGMGLLDATLARPEASLVPLRLDLARMQRQLGEVPALLRALLRPGLQRVEAVGVAASALRQRLVSLSEEERLAALVTLVQEKIAEVLGLPGAEAVPADHPIEELSLDSLMEVDVRSRLSALTETTLPAILALDYPTPEAIAKLLLHQAFSELDPAVVTASPTHRTTTLRESAYVSEPWRSEVAQMTFRPPATEHVGQSVLLTGATGFIGTHLVQALLDRDVERLTCLVRAQDSDHAAIRLQDALVHRGLGFLASEVEGRIRVLAGDITRPYLGLDRHTYERLADETRLVGANAAVVHWLHPYSVLAPPNVGGIARLLQFTAAGNGARFALVSSVAAATQFPEVPHDYWSHTEPSFGYVLSKWAAERLVETARARDLEAIMFRPSFVTASSRTGTINTGQAEAQLVRSFVRLECVPDVDWPVDFTPVDYVAQVIASLSVRPHVDGLYNILHPECPRFFDVARLIRDLGGNCRTVSLGDYHTRLSDLVAAGERDFAPLLEFVPILEKVPRLDASRTHEIIRGESISSDPMNALRQMVLSFMGQSPVEADDASLRANLTGGAPSTGSAHNRSTMTTSKERQKMATTEEILNHRLQCFASGDLDGLMSGYADDAILFTPEGILRGLGGIRPLLEAFLAEWSKDPAANRFEVGTQLVEGNLAYIVYSGETPDNTYHLVTDTFIIRDGKIVQQTFAGHISAKG